MIKMELVTEYPLGDLLGPLTSWIFYGLFYIAKYSLPLYLGFIVSFAKTDHKILKKIRRFYPIFYILALILFYYLAPRTRHVWHGLPSKEVIEQREKLMPF